LEALTLSSEFKKWEKSLSLNLGYLHPIYQHIGAIEDYILGIKRCKLCKLKQAFIFIFDKIFMFSIDEKKEHTRKFIYSISKFCENHDNFSEIMLLIDNIIIKYIKESVKQIYPSSKFTITSFYPYRIELKSKKRDVEKFFNKISKNIGLKPIFNLDKGYYNREDEQAIKPYKAIHPLDGYEFDLWQ
jgi:hypothetical protein